MNRKLLILSLALVVLWVLVIVISFFLGRQGRIPGDLLRVEDTTEQVENQKIQNVESPIEKEKMEEEVEAEVISGPLLN